MAKQTWINVDGTWRKIKSAWVNVSGVWKKDVIPKGVVSGGYKEFMSYFTNADVIFANSHNVFRSTHDKGEIVDIKTSASTGTSLRVWNIDVHPTSKRILVLTPSGLHCQDFDGNTIWAFNPEQVRYAFYNPNGSITIKYSSDYVDSLYSTGQSYDYKYYPNFLTEIIVMDSSKNFYYTYNGRLHKRAYSNNSTFTWRTNLPVTSTTSLFMMGNYIYATGYDSSSNYHAIKVDLNGNIIKTFMVNYAYTICADLSENIFVGTSTSGYLYKFDKEGNRKWRITIGGIIHYIAPDKDGYIYVRNNDGVLYKVSQNGDVVWSHSSGLSGLGQSITNTSILTSLGDYNRFKSTWES